VVTVKNCPAAALSLDTLGWILYRKNRMADAVRDLEPAAQKAPDNAAHQDHLGMAYVQTGDWRRAETALERALAPNFDEAADARKALTTIGG
jgi:Flp pilus assembly protein TadD